MWKQKIGREFEKALGRHSGESRLNSFLLRPVWKQINLVEYFEKTLGCHSGESLSIFLCFVTYVEANKFGRVF